MSRYSQDLIQKTRGSLEPKYRRQLSEGEVEEALDNLVGYFKILIDWDLKEKQCQRGAYIDLCENNRKISFPNVDGVNPEVILITNAKVNNYLLLSSSPHC